MNVLTCDITGQPVSLNDGILVVRTDTGEWFFCSQEGELHVPNRSRFPPIHNLNDQASLIELLGHVGNKPWFNPILFFQKIAQIRPY